MINETGAVSAAAGTALHKRKNCCISNAGRDERYEKINWPAKKTDEESDEKINYAAAAFIGLHQYPEPLSYIKRDLYRLYRL